MLAGAKCYSGKRLRGILASKGLSLTHISPFPQGTGPQSPSSPSEKPRSPSGKAPSPGNPPPTSPPPALQSHVTKTPVLPGWVAWWVTDGKAQRQPPSSPAPRPEQHSLQAPPPGPWNGWKCQASPDPRLLHLFHFLGPGDHPVDNFLLLICQLFLLPLSVGLTTGMDRPARLEPER